MSPPVLSTRVQNDIDWFNGRFMRHVNKEKSQGPPPIDMGTAENWLIRNEIVSIIEDAMSAFPPHLLSYSQGLGGSKDLLRAAAGFFNTFFAPLKEVEPEHIVTGAGASALLDTLLYCICEKGDGILVEAPFWGSFGVYSMMRNNVSLVPVAVPSSVVGVDEYVGYFRNAVLNSQCPIRAILFCNPQNPQAHLHTRDRTEGLLRFCQEADLHFISDELYGLSTFGQVATTHVEEGSSLGEVTNSPETRFTSAMNIDVEELGVDASRIHILYSVSKDFGSSGLRMGLFVTQASSQLRYCMAILNHSRVSNATGLIVTRLLSRLPELDHVLLLSTRRLRSAAATAIDFLTFHKVSFYNPVAGVYIWAKLGKDGGTWDDEASLTSRFAAEGVFVGIGADYSNAEPGWFRLSFAIPREALLDGLQRIERALNYEKFWRISDVGDRSV